MAQERAIQAGQAAAYQDPLAGDVIMDATARLLAPKGSADRAAKQSASRPEEESPALRQEGQGGGSRRRRRKKRPAQEAQVQSGQKAQSGQKPQKAQKTQKPQNAQKAPDPQSAQRAQNGQKASARRDRGRSRRGGPPEVVLRPGNQKDSTEQPSLMRPYYLTPED